MMKSCWFALCNTFIPRWTNIWALLSSRQSHGGARSLQANDDTPKREHEVQTAWWQCSTGCSRGKRGEWLYCTDAIELQCHIGLHRREAEHFITHVAGFVDRKTGSVSELCARSKHQQHELRKVCGHWTEKIKWHRWHMDTCSLQWSTFICLSSRWVTEERERERERGGGGRGREKGRTSSWIIL